MTGAGDHNLDARIADAENRLQANETGDRSWWSLAMGFGDFNEYPLLMSRVWHLLPADQRAVAIGAAWQMADPPGKFLPLPEWLEKFRDVGYIENQIGGATQATPPTEEITLWRGGITANGLSWTTERSRAEWFQHRYDGEPDKLPGKLWTATVRADRLLARFDKVHRPGENEYVIDPDGLDPTEVC